MVILTKLPDGRQAQYKAKTLTKWFSLILVREPYLNHILEKQVHEALRQRITVHYNYEGLSDWEVPDYIQHELELAGGNGDILGGDAVSDMHKQRQIWRTDSAAVLRYENTEKCCWRCYA